jgi:hypothetical protein
MKAYLQPRSYPNAGFQHYHRHERSYYVTLNLNWLMGVVGLVELALILFLINKAW